jgi:nitronate monooxygenase/enoyl-[acyl-carrier protein] reductase II
VIRFEVWQEIFPATSSAAYPTAPRVLRTAFVEAWRRRPGEAKQQADQLRGEILTAVREHRPADLLPFAGQSAGLIHEVLPAGEIVRRIVSDAQQALQGAISLLR